MNKQYPNEYNGHRNWDYWNVALWMGNSEPFYRWAVELRRRMSAREAARELKANLNPETPDGAKYTQNNLEAALRHIGE